VQWLGGIVVQLLKWVLPLIVHELIDAYKKAKAKRAEKKHSQAADKMEKAETEEEQKDALRDLVDNP